MSSGWQVQQAPSTLQKIADTASTRQLIQSRYMSVPDQLRTPLYSIRRSHVTEGLPGELIGSFHHVRSKRILMQRDHNLLVFFPQATASPFVDVLFATADGTFIAKSFASTDSVAELFKAERLDKNMIWSSPWLTSIGCFGDKVLPAKKVSCHISQFHTRPARSL